MMNLYKKVYKVNEDRKYMLSVSLINKSYISFLFEIVYLNKNDVSVNTADFFLSVDDARILSNHILNYKMQLLPLSRTKGSPESNKVRALNIGVNNKEYNNCYVQIKNGTGDIKNGIRTLNRVDTNYFYNCTYDDLIVIFHKIDSCIRIIDFKNFKIY